MPTGTLPSEAVSEPPSPLVKLHISVENYWRGVRAHPVTVSVTLLAAVIYWFLRVYYWHVVHEQPFSDMADYVSVANSILSSFRFSPVPFWKSYWSPGLPVSIASVFLVFGKGNQPAWQFCQALFNFSAALWFCAEVAIATRKRFLFPLCFLVIAMSKSSIFWSLKFATESLIESQAYLLLALALNNHRRPRLWKASVFGFLFAYAFLTKPSIFPALPVFILLLCLSGTSGARDSWKQFASRFKSGWRRPITLVAAFCVGMFALWTPWMIRSFRLYGHIVPFNTDEPLAMLWEQWTYTIQIDGRPVTRSVSNFLQTGPTDFRNDYELYRFANLFSEQWYFHQWHRFPMNVLDRLVRMFTLDTDLTHVSRQRLFNNIIDILLIDRSFLVFLLAVATAVVGLLSRDPIQMGIFAVLVVPVLAIISMSGNPRHFEPYITLSNVNAVIGCHRLIVYAARHEFF
jgi:ABC-type multidrug transport system fused ATPase/permease subunit